MNVNMLKTGRKIGCALVGAVFAALVWASPASAEESGGGAGQDFDCAELIRSARIGDPELQMNSPGQRDGQSLQENPLYFVYPGGFEIPTGRNRLDADEELTMGRGKHLYESHSEEFNIHCALIFVQFVDNNPKNQDVTKLITFQDESKFRTTPILIINHYNSDNMTNYKNWIEDDNINIPVFFPEFTLSDNGFGRFIFNHEVIGRITYFSNVDRSAYVYTDRELKWNEENVISFNINKNNTHISDYMNDYGIDEDTRMIVLCGVESCREFHDLVSKNGGESQDPLPAEDTEEPAIPEDVDPTPTLTPPAPKNGDGSTAADDKDDLSTDANQGTGGMSSLKLSPYAQEHTTLYDYDGTESALNNENITFNFTCFLRLFGPHIFAGGSEGPLCEDEAVINYARGFPQITVTDAGQWEVRQTILPQGIPDGPYKVTAHLPYRSNPATCQMELVYRTPEGAPNKPVFKWVRQDENGAPITPPRFEVDLTNPRIEPGGVVNVALRIETPVACGGVSRRETIHLETPPYEMLLNPNSGPNNVFLYAPMARAEGLDDLGESALRVGTTNALAAAHMRFANTHGGAENSLSRTLAFAYNTPDSAAVTLNLANMTETADVVRAFETVSINSPQDDPVVNPAQLEELFGKMFSASALDGVDRVVILLTQMGDGYSVCDGRTYADIAFRLGVRHGTTVEFSIYKIVTAEQIDQEDANSLAPVNGQTRATAALGGPYACPPIGADTVRIHPFFVESWSRSADFAPRMFSALADRIYTEMRRAAEER